MKPFHWQDGTPMRFTNPDATYMMHIGKQSFSGTKEECLAFYKSMGSPDDGWVIEESEPLDPEPTWFEKIMEFFGL